MWKAAAVALAGVMMWCSGALAGGESVIGKSPPATKIRKVTTSPPSYELKGDIEAGAEDLLAEVVGDTKGGVITLESDGGEVDAALALGRLIRAHRIATGVAHGKCLSACAIVWVAGVTRYKGASADIGFHHPWHLEDGKVVKGDSAKLVAYFKEMGLTDAAIEEFMGPPETFYYLTGKKSRGLGLKMYYQDYGVGGSTGPM